MNLSNFMPKGDIIMGLAERVSNRYPDPTGQCEAMTEELVKELKQRGISAKHAIGMFRLDEPDARRYAEFDDEEGQDEYEVEHDWVEVAGKILDVSARQFKKSVQEDIPDIVFVGHANPLANRYQLVNFKD